MREILKQVIAAFAITLVTTLATEIVRIASAKLFPECAEDFEDSVEEDDEEVKEKGDE